MCSIHHRAFDENLVGVTPDYEVRVSARLLDEDDGPMLDFLKTFHEQAIVLPKRRGWQPDRERLAARFDQFAAASRPEKVPGARLATRSAYCSVQAVGVDW